MERGADVRPACRRSSRYSPSCAFSPSFRMCLGRRNCRGFTLIEVVLALTISAILLGSLVTSTRAIARSREHTYARLDRTANAQRAMQTILGALRNVRRDPSQQAPLIIGKNDANGSSRIDMQVIGDHPARADGVGTDQQEVGFYIERSAAGMPVLMCRRDIALDDKPTEGGVATLVAEGIVDLHFEYYQGGQWYREWASTQPQPPQAVRVTLSAASPARQGKQSGGTQDREVVTLSAAVAIKVNSPTNDLRNNNDQPSTEGGAGREGGRR